MFLNSLNDCINLGICFTLSKFPKEAKDYKRNKFALFEMSEMVTDELVKKHGDLLIKPYIDHLVNVKEKDLNIVEGNMFYLE